MHAAIMAVAGQPASCTDQDCRHRMPSMSVLLYHTTCHGDMLMASTVIPEQYNSAIGQSHTGLSVAASCCQQVPPAVVPDDYHPLQ